MTHGEDMSSEIERKIDDLAKELREFREEMRVWTATKKRDCEAHQRDTTEVRTSVYGNGTPGLKARMQDVESSQRLIRGSLFLLVPIVGAVVLLALWHVLGLPGTPPGI